MTIHRHQETSIWVLIDPVVAQVAYQHQETSTGIWVLIDPVISQRPTGIKLPKLMWKATVITIGGLAAGAVVGSAVENWLQVDIVPFLGIHSPATIGRKRKKSMRQTVELQDPVRTLDEIIGLYDSSSSSGSTSPHAHHDTLDEEARLCEMISLYDSSSSSNGSPSPHPHHDDRTSSKISMSPLEAAKDLEKQALMGLHWEKKAAAQPMRLEGVRKGSTMGYFSH